MFSVKYDKTLNVGLFHPLNFFFNKNLCKKVRKKQPWSFLSYAETDVISKTVVMCT